MVELGGEACRRGMEGCTSTLPGCCTALALGIEHRTSPCRHYGVIRWVTPQGEGCSAIEWRGSCQRPTGKAQSAKGRSAQHSPGHCTALASGSNTAQLPRGRSSTRDGENGKVILWRPQLQRHKGATCEAAEDQLSAV